MDQDLKFPKRGICMVCEDNENCPIPGMLKTEEVEYPEVSMGKVLWCPMYYNERDFDYEKIL